MLSTTVGSYPRKDKPKDTLRKPTVSEEEALIWFNGQLKINAVLVLTILLMASHIRKHVLVLSTKN